MTKLDMIRRRLSIFEETNNEDINLKEMMLKSVISLSEELLHSIQLEDVPNNKTSNATFDVAEHARKLMVKCVNYMSLGDEDFNTVENFKNDISVFVSESPALEYEFKVFRLTNIVVTNLTNMRKNKYMAYIKLHKISTISLLDEMFNAVDSIEDGNTSEFIDKCRRLKIDIIKLKNQIIKIKITQEETNNG